jgi:class 3 adenylate cyclase
MTATLSRWITRYAYSASLPTDTEEQRLRKAILVLMVSMTTAAGLIWGFLYIYLGYPQSGLIPIVYSVICVISLIRFLLYGNYPLFGYTQLVLMLLLPFLLQVSLGGFAAASAVILWSFSSALGALMFFGAKQARLWFVMFVGLILVAGLIDSELSKHAVVLPPIMVTLFFVMNVIGPLLVSYLILLYFVAQRDEAQELSERLLLNVLPYPIAQRLKREPGMIADEYTEVTILFADIVNFTPFAQNMLPTQVVEILGEIFTAIDRIADSYGIEKIKTIGDAYMAVAGLPKPRPDHAEAIASMALDMLETLPQLPVWRDNHLNFRIGINTGPVVAGVIGEKKFIYDLWGDAVNTASRMESHGQIGGIHVTKHTYECLKDRYVFEPRGVITVKGKGDMETYLLRGRK